MKKKEIKPVYHTDSLVAWRAGCIANEFINQEFMLQRRTACSKQQQKTPHYYESK